MAALRDPRDSVRVAAYSAAAWLAKRLPEPLVRRAFAAAADVAWRNGGRGVEQLRRNLRRVVSPTMPDAEFEALVRLSMRSYARYWLEFFRLPAIPRERVGAMHVAGEDRLAAALQAGRGAVLALPHCGNWDHAGAWIVQRGYPFTTVAERLKPDALFDKFVRVRERLGMEVLPLTGGDRNTFAVLTQRLRAGGLVCLVSERDLGDTGVEVSFFGEPMSMPAGPAALALHTGAALFPTTVWFTNDPVTGPGWAGRIHPEVAPPAGGDRRSKVAAMTQAIADDFAVDIAAHPTDWHMLQPLWLADRPAAAIRPPVASGVGAGP